MSTSAGEQWRVALACDYNSVGERLVLGADVTHYASGLDDHRFPMFADDFAAQAASAERLRALRDAGATVRPGHDPAVLAPGPVTPVGCSG